MHRERTTGKKRKQVRKSYLVKWLGYGDEHSSWEPECNLTPACLQEYWASKARVLEVPKARKGAQVAPGKGSLGYA